MMILRELNDPRLVGLPSITHVKVSPDLSQADVYVTVMGTPGQQSAALNALKHSAGMMRSLLTKALSLRSVPMLKFHIDEQQKREIAVLDLLRKVAQENEELDRQRGSAGGVSDAEPETAAGGAAGGDVESATDDGTDRS